MYFLINFFSKIIKKIILLFKNFLYLFVIFEYIISLLVKKNISSKKCLYYGSFFLNLNLFNISKKILSKLPKNSKEFMYAQFFLGSYIFNNLKKNPKSYLENFFFIKNKIIKNEFYPPKLIIYLEKNKNFNLSKKIQKYISLKNINSYSDFKQKEIYRYYQSEHNLHKLKDFKPFSKYIENKLNLKKNYLFKNKKKVRVKIDKLWFVKSRRGVDLLPHNHPEGVISGIYYFKVPKKFSPGILKIKNPRKNIKIISNTNVYKAKNKEIIIKPVKNLIIIFNSYLLHSVINQQSDEDRISLPFDANLYQN